MVEGLWIQGRENQSSPFNVYFNKFLDALGLHGCVGFSLVESSGDYSPAAAHGFLTSVASFAAEHRFQGQQAQ